MNSAFRPYLTAGILVGASIIVTTPAISTPISTQVRAVQLMSTAAADAADTTTVALIMAGSGVPIWPANLVSLINALYIQPDFPGAIPQALGTPMDFYPIVGDHSGFADPSVQAGVTILDQAIEQQIAQGHHVVVFGISQGATIESVEMRDLQALPAYERPTPDQLSFVMTGDGGVPNGGLFTRFNFPDLPANLTFPAIGTTFSDETPQDAYPTSVYSGEYDPFSDFPQYPLNGLADLNSLEAILYQHELAPFTPSQRAEAIHVPTSPEYDGNVTYYVIPAESLPLLEPLRSIPVIGDPLADLLQPDLTVLVNLGYGPDNVGYSEDPNVLTPAGLFPDANPTTVLNELVTGAQQGMQNFTTDLSRITPSSATAALTDLLTNPVGVLSGLASEFTTIGVIPEAFTIPPVTPLDLNPGNFVSEFQTLLNDNSNALVTTTSNSLDTLMPAVDDGTSLGTVFTMDADLAIAGLNHLAAGDLNAASTDFGDIGSGTSGLTWMLDYEVWTAASQASQTIETALESAISEDLNFVAGLPGLL